MVVLYSIPMDYRSYFLSFVHSFISFFLDREGGKVKKKEGEELVTPFEKRREDEEKKKRPDVRRRRKKRGRKSRLRTYVPSNDDTMVALKGFQGQLFERLDTLFAQLLHLSGEDGFGSSSAVDAVGFDADDDAAADFEEEVGVEADDARLVGLGHVREDDVNHAEEHAIAERVTRVFDDGDDVGAMRRHVDQISAGSMGEFHGEDYACRSNDVGNMGDRSARRGAEIEHLGTRADEDVVKAAENAGC